MSISILEQPSTNDLKAAYRPIVFKVRATQSAAPPVAYCDIYFGGTFYRTICKTQYYASGSGFTDWQFDIQDACQEFLDKVPPANGGRNILYAQAASGTVYCKFRGSTLDSNGFIAPETAIPVQATGTQAAVSGGGLQSNTFYTLNCTLQHINNQSLGSHLSAYKIGTWSASAWPLTHRPNLYRIAEDGSDYLPIFYIGTGTIDNIVLHYRLKNQTAFSSARTINASYSIVLNTGAGTETITFTWDTIPNAASATISWNDGAGWIGSTGSATSPQSITLPISNYQFRVNFNLTTGESLLIDFGAGTSVAGVLSSNKGVLYIPDGPKNLALIFTAIDWKQVDQYYIEVLSGSTVIATTPTYNVCHCRDDHKLRLTCLNYLGAFDSVDFPKPKITHQVTSGQFRKGLNYPLNKQDRSIERFDVHSNNSYEAKRISREEEQDWLMECADSVLAFLQWLGIEGQSDDYIPVIIQDDKFQPLKNVNDYQYEFVLQFALSNDNINLRN